MNPSNDQLSEAEPGLDVTQAIPRVDAGEPSPADDDPPIAESLWRLADEGPGHLPPVDAITHGHTCWYLSSSRAHPWRCTDDCPPEEWQQARTCPDHRHNVLPRPTPAPTIDVQGIPLDRELDVLARCVDALGELAGADEEALRRAVTYLVARFDPDR